MNEQQLKDLFTSLPFREAKDKIIEHLKMCGTNLTGNESIWELKSLALNTHSGNPDNVAKDYAKGGLIDCNIHDVVDDDIDVIEPSNNPPEQQEPEPIDPEPDVQDNNNDKTDEPVNDTEPNAEPNNDDTNNQHKKRKRRTKEETNKDKLERIDNDKKKKEEQLRKLQDEMEKLKEEEDRIKEEERKRKEQEEEEKRRQQQAQNNKKHKNEDEIVRRLKCLKKAFLVGPAGTGKSTLAMKACAEIFNIEGGVDGVVKSDKFAQISFSPDTVSADMIGFQDVNGVFHETDIIRVFRDGGLILFDEMDDADASLLVKLNTMIANGVIPTPNGVVTQNENTYIVGTANTFGKGANAMYVGRNRLDAATLDRWKLATIFIDYDTDLEDGLIDMQVEDKTKVAEIKIARDTIRKIIENNKYKQICSTRFVIDAIKLSNSGYPINKIVDIFLLDWDEKVAGNVKSSVRNELKDNSIRPETFSNEHVMLF
jgi:MoxR-like ATPase